MKPYDFLYVIGDVADDLVSEAKEATMKEKSGRKPLRMILIGAAVVAVLTVGALAARYYTRSADMLEEKWNNSLGAETSMTEEQKNFIDERSADLGESVTDGGVTITVDSVTATADTVYLNLSYQVEEDVYEGTIMEICGSPSVTAESEAWGTQEHTSGSGGISRMENGAYVDQKTCLFRELPEGARLSDGTVTLTVAYTEVAIYYEDANGEHQEKVVEGSWRFLLPIPESDAVDNAEIREDISFTGPLDITLTEIQLTESGLTFDIKAPSNDYVVIGTDMLPLAKAAEPESTFYTVEALLEDGTRVPSDGANMSLNEETGMDQWQIRWVAPIDPSQVVSLIFSDGETEQEVQMNE